MPAGGGQQLAGADIKPAKLVRIPNRTSRQVGTYEDVYDGVDFSLNTRLGAGTVLRGGFSTGRERISRCFAIDSPQADLENARPYPAHAGTTPHLCKTSPPFQTQAKMIASFTLPGDVILAGTFQNTPGPQITATYQVRASQTTLVASSLRNDSTTKDVEMLHPTLFGPRVNQVDLRVSKVFVRGTHTPASELRPVQCAECQRRPSAAERVRNGRGDLAETQPRVVGSPGETGLQPEFLVADVRGEPKDVPEEVERDSKTARRWFATAELLVTQSRSA